MRWDMGYPCRQIRIKIGAVAGYLATSRLFPKMFRTLSDFKSYGDFPADCLKIAIWKIVILGLASAPSET
jgi:hypothetical protein